MKDIVEKVYTILAGDEPYLIEVKWQPCSTRAELVLLLGCHAARLLLDGVHFFGTRQSMVGRDQYRPPSYESREDWGVHYFDILPNSPFLTAFLDNRLGFSGRVMLYDKHGNQSGDSLPSTKPVHVALYSGGGDLDIVCEMVTLAIDPGAMTSTE
jgi:hypothetical protein